MGKKERKKPRVKTREKGGQGRPLYKKIDDQISRSYLLNVKQKGRNYYTTQRFQ